VWQPYSDHWVLRTWFWRPLTSSSVEWSLDAAYEEMANGEAAAGDTLQQVVVVLATLVDGADGEPLPSRWRRRSVTEP
jgi:hypothetical protein